MLMEFVRYIKTNTGECVYPIKFPTDAPDTCLIVEFTGGTAPRGSVSTLYVQITVRAPNTQGGELIAGQLNDFLDKLTNTTIGAKQLILSEAQQSEPQYVGTDENGRSLFSISFKLIVG